MVKLAIERESDVPLYRQLANQLRTLIRTGSLPPGARLPPVREVAAELGLTRLTVHSAYAELQAQGLTEAVVGRGTFVAADARTGSTGMVVGAVPPPTPWLSQSLLAELTP
ncbi:MAG: GntR family transcriptional regulator, partial [Ktedonobacterales bacterium]